VIANMSHITLLIRSRKKAGRARDLVLGYLSVTSVLLQNCLLVNFFPYVVSRFVDCVSGDSMWGSEEEERRTANITNNTHSVCIAIAEEKYIANPSA